MNIVDSEWVVVQTLVYDYEISLADVLRQMGSHECAVDVYLVSLMVRDVLTDVVFLFDPVKGWLKK